MGNFSTALTTSPIAVQFHGHQLLTQNLDGKPFVAIRSICENLGRAWHGQWERINRHPVLKSVVRVTRTTAKDGKEYETIMLPLSKLNGWLFGISVSRIKPELRERLIEYQRECFDVLAAYWNDGVAINPREVPPNGGYQSQPAALNIHDMETLKASREAAVKYFDDFRASVKRGGPCPGPEIPVEVLQGIISEALSSARFMVSFGFDGRVNVRLLEPDDRVTSPARLAKAIRTNDTWLKPDDLVALHAACAQKLEQGYLHMWQSLRQGS